MSSCQEWQFCIATDNVVVKNFNFHITTDMLVVKIDNFTFQLTSSGLGMAILHWYIVVY